jgi:hypothetical protein
MAKELKCRLEVHADDLKALRCAGGLGHHVFITVLSSEGVRDLQTETTDVERAVREAVEMGVKSPHREPRVFSCAVSGKTGKKVVTRHL